MEEDGSNTDGWLCRYETTNVLNEVLGLWWLQNRVRNMHCYFATRPLCSCTEAWCIQMCRQGGYIPQRLHKIYRSVCNLGLLQGHYGMFFVPIYVSISQSKYQQASPKNTNRTKKATWLRTVYLFVFANLQTTPPVFVWHTLLHNQSYDIAAANWQQRLWILCNVKCKQGKNTLT